MFLTVWHCHTHTKLACRTGGIFLFILGKWKWKAGERNARVAHKNSLQNRRNFLRILGKWRRKGGERKARVAHEGRSVKIFAGFFSAPLLARNSRFALASRLPRFCLYSPKICKKFRLFCRLIQKYIINIWSAFEWSHKSCKHILSYVLFDETWNSHLKWYSTKFIDAGLIFFKICKPFILLMFLNTRYIQSLTWTRLYNNSFQFFLTVSSVITWLFIYQIWPRLCKEPQWTKGILKLSNSCF